MGDAPSDRRQDAAAEAVGSGAAPGGAGAPPSNTAPHNCNWTDGFAVLRSGVDTLQLSYRGELYGEWSTRLDKLKELARSQDRAEQAFAQAGVAGHVLSVLPRGSGLFPYVLVDPWYRISISEGKKSLPVAFVQISSEVLTKQGTDSAEKNLRSILSTLLSVSDGPFISRIDVCVDFACRFDMESISRRSWVTRAKRISQYVENDRFTGWSIGLKGQIACRLYDKTAEILVSDKPYFRELWRDCGWDGETPVWRLEFEVKREALRQFGAYKLSDVDELCAGLWPYLTGSWLRLACPSKSDETRSRWSTHPMWKRLQAIDFTLLNIPALQRVSRSSTPSDDWMFRNAGTGILGYMAVEEIDDFDEGLSRFGSAYLRYLDKRSVLRGSSTEEYIGQKIRELCRKHNLRLNKSPPGRPDPVAKALAHRYRKGKAGE